jgi:hypothetical protein
MGSGMSVNISSLKNSIHFPLFAESNPSSKGLHQEGTKTARGIEIKKQV